MASSDEHPPEGHAHEQSLVDAFDSALGAYDAHLAGHASRVGNLAGLLAAQLDLDRPDRLLVTHIAIVHDLGKLGLPREILNKKGRLSPEERAAVQQHPVIGADVLLAMSRDLDPLAAGVRAHHERWDGTGYPDHLSGTQIPFFGRLLAVMDVYDALTHPRIYRNNVFTPEAAREYLAEHSGTQFDPECVSASLEVLIAHEKERRQFPAS
ncbi:MAG: HD-GYP domain-containing protein [Acidimicrobiales bacterium]|jgi:HD-GYP domain-containing protein (c-di-GMP phosphodiesterase class II)